jgi:uncharacterized protein (TIGR02452 family)
MFLVDVANETLQIVESGTYTPPAGAPVSIADAVARAVSGTCLHRPGDPLELPDPGPSAAPRAVEVTGETTAAAARRLVEGEGLAHVAALNFASGKNAGGGFLRGAKAQEEDLARCSALYTCLVTQPDYYAANRASGTMLYTDHIIYSPGVPFFRDDRLELLPAPFLASMITAPAPNAGEHLARRPGERAEIHAALERRAERVLRVAAVHGHRALVLGAWGCGVFGNDPAEVADVFARLLDAPPFARAFDRVVFGVYDRSRERATLRAFEERFAPR